ncbi:MAG: DUF5343 domain-containing protein [Vicinamibacterales bacterium]|jgi:hypothetical protein
MATDLPYLMSPKRFPELLSKLQTAAVPERVTFEFLKKLGFTSSNDRAFPTLLKRLGFLDPNGQPTDRYRAYRQKTHAKRVLAEGIREVYADLLALHTDAHTQDREAVKGLVSRVTGREQRYVDLITTTFEMLCENADFTTETEQAKASVHKPETEKRDDKKHEEKKPEKSSHEPGDKAARPIAFSYNIQIHLPATTEIAVYNAIFKSLKEHLGD